MKTERNTHDTQAEKANATLGSKELPRKVFYLIDPKTLHQTDERLILRTRR